ncbi:MAG: 2-succinyl-5-enolpyruvyl-6-hydroxy-3-cyclohexene-1-carboxylic-acid synthase [Ktedonobacteraceae bacterium]
MPEISSASPLPVNPTYTYVSAFVDELQRAGVHHVIICPGSRSTPLAVAFADQLYIRSWMHIDERSAAFFALGMAKQLRQPVALLCTSGTAAANFLPAIVEAKLTHIPLLILTADRPHELRDCGAPQAIDQNRLYGTYTKWFVDVALPEASNTALRYIRTLACRAAATASAIPVGPVHLNFPFREPLTPEPIIDQVLPPLAQRDAQAWQGKPGNAPYVQVSNALLAAPSPTEITRLVDIVGKAQRGLIIVGPNDNTALLEPLIQLARRLHYPIVADPLSQLRCGRYQQDLVISSYDAFLRVEQFVENMRPALILRFGAMPTSKPLLLYLKHYTHSPHIVIDGQNNWHEPTQLASEMIHADPAAFCQHLLTSLEVLPANEQWITTWQHIDQVTRQTLQSEIERFPVPFEGRVFTELATILPEHTTLFTGNSMPIRDLDTFFWSSECRIQLLGNRGANGIDGLVSSALGVSAVSSNAEPTILVLGDLSFFHDLNGLLAARLHQLNLTIVLVNNDGGGIFSFLPQAMYTEHFEQLFATPTGLAFRLAVQMYGGRFQHVDTWPQFREEINRSIKVAGLHVIEVTTERESNVSMHRHLWQAVSRALAEQSILARGDA